MRRRLSLTAALVLLLSLLCACAAQHAQEMDENGYELYFLSDPNSAGGGDAIRTQEKRLTLDGAMETEDCVRALMEALLAGPDEPSLSSPIPEGTALKSLKVSGRRAQIDLSAQYARLTGIDLSLADYCITLTLTQLPNVNAVSITADGRELPYRETQVLLSADTLLSSRESGLRPITVSLYFLDSKTGELRAEQQTYLTVYDMTDKKPHENPSIGIVLCQDANRQFVEIMVRDYDKPMGVATYRTAQEMPENLRKTLPDIDKLQNLLSENDSKSETVR